MGWFPAPTEIRTRVWARLPDAFRVPQTTAWSRANKGGAALESFLEGPCFDAQGRLVVTDIPNGRIFRIDPAGGTAWQQIARYDGWPNGLKVRADGTYLVADYRRGLVAVDPRDGAVSDVLPTVRSEAFKGINDVCVAADGAVYFTDQGQTGMQDPTGRVYRLTAQGALHCLVDTCPSPNGVVVDRSGQFLFVALTRACQVWRLPLTADARVSKAQVFCQLPGGVSGPDGLAVDRDDGVLVANPGHGCAWRLDRYGVPTHRIVSCAGRSITNLCFGGPDRSLVFLTDSETGHVLVADAPVPG
jgi:gluconolactonase